MLRFIHQFENGKKSPLPPPEAILVEGSLAANSSAFPTTPQELAAYRERQHREQYAQCPFRFSLSISYPTVSYGCFFWWYCAFVFPMYVFSHFLRQEP
jgi:hypothetical protein